MSVISEELRTLSLKRLCVPRDLSKFAIEVETVHDLADLAEEGKLDPDEFFETTFVTKGMAQLIRAVFGRLTGKGGNSVLYLSQSMGGGKTHSLLAAGLLAKRPELGRKLEPHGLGGLEVPSGVKVLSFSGRSHNVAFWESLAAQLGEPHAFRTPEGRLIVPAPEDWIRLFADQKVLILLDEIPPYFESIAGRGHGSVSACSVGDLTTGLVSLMGAAVKTKDVVVVFTDLGGKVYDSNVTASVLSELRKVEQESVRLVTRIEPIDLGSDEFFSVLRARFFTKLPTQARVEALADAYVTKYRDLRKSGVIGDVGFDADFKQEIVRAYPFHPMWKELYARIRNNLNFQQTRGLLRLVGAQLAAFFASDEDLLLIGPQHLPMADPQVHAQLMSANKSLDTALAVDVAASGAAKPSALVLDSREGYDGLALEMATLLFVASLPNSEGQVPGLTDVEIRKAFISPAQDMAQVVKLLQPGDGLAAHCEYLHYIPLQSRFVFKAVQNPIAVLQRIAGGYSEPAVIEKLSAYLRQQLASKTKAVYDDVLAFPAVQDIQLGRDKVTLVIEGGQPLLDPEYREFHERAAYKNRVIFLANSRKFGAVIDAARFYFAANEVSQSLQDAASKSAFEPIARDKTAKFDMAVSLTYNTLYYPSDTGLTEKAGFKTSPKNAMGLEAAIETTLREENKLYDNPSDKRLIISVERLMTPKRLKWSSLLDKAALTPGFPFASVKVLTELRDIRVRDGAWRWHADTEEVEKGPFSDKATVQVTTQRIEPDGTAVLRLMFGGANVVYGSESSDVSKTSPTAESEMRTKAPRLYFLPAHTEGVYLDGDVVEWRHPLHLSEPEETPDGKLRLAVFPAGTLTYSFSSTSLDVEATRYEGPLTVPAGAERIYVRAVLDGVQREQSFPLRGFSGSAASGPVQVSRRVKCTDRQSSLQVIEKLKQYAARANFSVDIGLAGGKTISVTCSQDYDAKEPWTPAVAEEMFAVCLRDFAKDSSDSVNLTVTDVVFHDKVSAESFAKATGETFDERDFKHVR